VIGTLKCGMLFNTYSVQLPLDGRGDDMKLFIHAYLKIIAGGFYFGGEEGVKALRKREVLKFGYSGNLSRSSTESCKKIVRIYFIISRKPCPERLA
jgi:hypothetical protein